jgi:hypothetical protein
MCVCMSLVIIRSGNSVLGWLKTWGVWNQLDITHWEAQMEIPAKRVYITVSS